MGSGKTEIGQLIAEKLHLPFIDLDTYLENKEGLNVSEIFKLKGEIYFRKQESKYFLELLTSNNNIVLSLGGGTPCYANNHLLLNSSKVVSFYLKAKVSTLKNRLEAETNKRPLLKEISVDDLASYIGPHLLERSYYYNYATFKIITDNKTVLDISEEIITILKN